MPFTPLLQRLIGDLERMPGIGRRTAQRLALHMLQHDREGGSRLVESLGDALTKIGKCAMCNNFSECERCAMCADQRRERSQLCVVEMPADAAALESAGEFAGLYFVLGGRLSPIDGVGPSEIALDALVERVAAREEGERAVEEVILATSETLEGQVTADYILSMLSHLQVRVTRIASGVPVGGELEYIDGGTLAHALSRRTVIREPGGRSSP